jgi:hypothetical protein
VIGVNCDVTATYFVIGVNCDVTATYFVIGVNCDVTPFIFADTANGSMRYGTLFFRKAAGLFEILMIVERKTSTFMEIVIRIFVQFILYFWKQT